MKLSVTQIVLGVLVIMAACYVMSWMIYEAPSQLKQPVPNDIGEVTYVDVVPENEVLFNISRYGSYILPVLGIAVLLIGALQSSRNSARTTKLISTNIVAGLLVAGLAFIITRWGYPTEFHILMPESSDTLASIFTNPGRSFLGVQSATAVILVFGLAVVGVGIAQLIKSRNI